MPRQTVHEPQTHKAVIIVFEWLSLSLSLTIAYLLGRQRQQSLSLVASLAVGHGCERLRFGVVDNVHEAWASVHLLHIAVDELEHPRVTLELLLRLWQQLDAGELGQAREQLRKRHSRPP